MASVAEVLGRVGIRDGDDLRQRTFPISDLQVVEWVWQKLQIASTATVQINLGGIGTTHIGKKILYVETDKWVKVQSVTVHAGTDLTAKTNYGNDVLANGFVLGSITNTTDFWITNRTTGVANVEIAVMKVT